MTATIHSIQISAGGVPKTAVPRAKVCSAGIHGDGHQYEHHGGPTRALCLYSLEPIESLAAEGHLITPGAIGENLTITGLDWERVAPGQKIMFADPVTRAIRPVMATVTEYATPCKKIRNLFKDGYMKRVSAVDHPGWARAYASVKGSGWLLPGDHVWLVR